MAVSCGGHWAASCGECVVGQGPGWCNGDCAFVGSQCVSWRGSAAAAAAVGQSVSCGGHRAPSCSACPSGHGATWCHGDCVWSGTQCAARQPPPGAAPGEAVLPWLHHKFLPAQGYIVGSENGVLPLQHLVAGSQQVSIQLECLLVRLQDAVTSAVAPSTLIATPEEPRGPVEHSAAAPEAEKPPDSVLNEKEGQGTAAGTCSSGGRADRCALPGAAGAVLHANDLKPQNPAGATGAVPRSGDKKPTQEQRWAPVAQEVREAFLHAWHGYRRHAWGMDELRPVSKEGRNSYGHIGMTILDSLTTLWLLDLPEEFERAAAFVENDLRFGLDDTAASVFELTIRALGGLLGAHSLTGRASFLRRARDLAERLLPAFNTTSGLPVPQWNLHQGEGDLETMPSVLAEAGSVQLEWRYLAERTGEPRFREAADAAFQAIQSTGARGLMPALMTPPRMSSPPRIVASKFSLGGQCDSYYEYLLKQWLLGDGREGHFKELFLRFMKELPALVRPPPAEGAGQPLRLLEAEPNGRLVFKMEHLVCFVPGMIALALITLPREDVGPHRRRWESMAEGLMASCVEMWTSTKSGLAPEHAHVSPYPPHEWTEVPPPGRHSLLRPETVESLYYMFRLTGNSRYREWGQQIFRAIVAHSRTEAGYSSVIDVNSVPTEKDNTMHSFVLAETFKYLYLLFAPPGLVDLQEYVFNTEGHPLRKAGRPSADT